MEKSAKDEGELDNTVSWSGTFVRSVSLPLICSHLTFRHALACVTLGLYTSPSLHPVLTRRGSPATLNTQRALSPVFARGNFTSGSDGSSNSFENEDIRDRYLQTILLWHVKNGLKITRRRIHMYTPRERLWMQCALANDFANIWTRALTFLLLRDLRFNVLASAL